jgi:ATP-dependent RNA helicase DDX31/DBP7
MMLTTISLSKWMASRWALDPSGRQDVLAGKSTWSQEVCDACEGGFEGSGGDGEGNNRDVQCPNDVYLQNAATVAFLLLEQMIAGKDTTGIAVEMENITVTARLSSSSEEDTTKPNDRRFHDPCAIKFVNVALQSNEEQPTSFFQSIALVLMKLFTRQEILPDWESVLPLGGVQSQSSEEGGYDNEEFESDMIKALSVLDGEGGGGFERRKGRQRQSMKSTTFDRVRNHFPALPSSVCRLISDLLDQPLGTKTSYASLSDVLEDLEQMVKDPDIFLHDSKVPCVKIEFGSRLYGRSAEVSQILDAAMNTSSERETGPLEVVSIGGDSGSGKSFLVRQVRRYLSRRGWIVIHGKFDRMHKSDAFSVVTSSFETFCGRIQQMRNGAIQSDVQYCSRVATAVLDALGPAGVGHLSRLMPGLLQMLGLAANTDSDSSDDRSINGSDLSPTQTSEEAVMSQRRRGYLLCSFIEAISGAGRPVLLFYDDMQWAQSSASDFMRTLLKHLAGRNASRKSIMFVQAFRDNEKGVQVTIHHETSSIETHCSVNITNIKLGGFSKEALNNILPHALRLPRRITYPLSEMIHQKTMGNALFVVEFIKTLESPDKKILTYSLDKRRWIWDADSIAVMTISDSVAGLIVKRLLSVEKSMLDSLILASCFGSQANVSVMALLNGMKRIDDIPQNLDAAVNEGILEKAGPFYMFAHDSIQQSVYELIPSKDRIQLHVDIGLMLISKSGHASRDVVEHIFTFAVSHINFALPHGAVSCTAIGFSPSQHVIFAKLNLTAGQKAVGKSDFALAEVHLKAGISFLPRNSWSDQYELTLQLFNEYTKVLFVRRKLDELRSHVDVILENGKCIGDKIEAHELMISLLTVKGSIQEALVHGASVLESLGFPVPSSLDRETIVGVVKSLSSSTMALTPEHLRSFQVMTEEIPLQAMKILGAFQGLYSILDTNLFLMMSCQMIELTMKHGLCVESAGAFANFGRCLIVLFNDFNAGHRMGELSLAILDILKATNRVSKVCFIVHGFLSIWNKPVQAVAEGFRYAINQGFLSGDYQNTLMSRIVMTRQMFMSGCHLSDLFDNTLQLCRDMIFEKSKNGIFVGFNNTLADLYFYISLIGEGQDKVYFIFNTSCEENETCLREQFHKTGFFHYSQIVYYHRLAKSFWFRDYDTSVKNCEEYWNVGTKRNEKLYDISQTFIWGLSSLILSRRKDEKRMVARGRESLEIMQSWVKGSMWNFENKALLLEAEYNFAMGNLAKAKLLYEQSIKSAHDHKFVHEEALAYELYAIFSIEIGDAIKGNDLLEKSRDLYGLWGAKKKAASMIGL